MHNLVRAVTRIIFYRKNEWHFLIIVISVVTAIGIYATITVNKTANYARADCRNAEQWLWIKYCIVYATIRMTYTQMYSAVYNGYNNYTSRYYGIIDKWWCTGWSLRYARYFVFKFNKLFTKINVKNKAASVRIQNTKMFLCKVKKKIRTTNNRSAGSQIHNFILIFATN